MEKPTVNHLLLQALDHYASFGVMTPQGPTVFLATLPDGSKAYWPIERTAALAHHILSGQDLYFLKLLHLLENLKKVGMDGMYQHLMNGETLDEAIRDLKAGP